MSTKVEGHILIRPELQGILLLYEDMRNTLRDYWIQFYKVRSGNEKLE